MPLILHIGLPKTGTTYLQKTFHSAFAHSDDAPLDYPDVGFYNHQVALYEPLGKHLPWAAKPGDPSHWQKLQACLNRPTERRMLLSAEALSALVGDGVRELAGLASAQSLEKIIITTRSLSSLLPSHWQQNMKQGGRGGLESYATRILTAIEEGKSPAQMFCFQNTIRLWRSVFGDVPVAVLVMDGSHTQNLFRFAELCGLGDEHRQRLAANVPSASEQNLSFSVGECRKLLVINEKIGRGELSTRARRKAIEVFFKSREQGAPYEKPALGAASKAKATKIDEQAFVDVQQDPHTVVMHGRDLASPATPPAPETSVSSGTGGAVAQPR